ncbi:hypothetical protein TPHA_0J01960 [Tetrapisispora phaffii CBS 4417]|uniref:Actin-related protein 2/3 complex subunit n=1 Tax=Tetrapisispora phaffii (strain ATCC 24235 / CBS 4417 / NBRC 1672 / NRRL Y-8282 / UCD 70-5) TaxID=1071381 RepID=G8BYS5_TETPH|nr:hypothetical protein TPHA_0J01960 [Tetrapisispora phaffii CBS 4417]CCE65017.1 hypothetical protein TPHA_0J01960 [Tetrapisispora phaffii CBS 4417]
MDNSVLAKFKLVKGPIYSHCFSADRTILAITCDTKCYIYRMQGANSPPKLHVTLENHDKTVTAVDISIHGRIVTCSQDRNAYVWEPLSDGTYKPTLVLLRINRAATAVSWAPNGYKFAVGSSARIVAVCYYEQENNWWVSKHIKKPIKSTINTLSWHSNGVLLATGGTDGYMRVFSGFIKGLDTKEAVTNSPWGEKFPFGSLIREFYQGSYINDVEWRSNLEKIAYVAQDGSLNVADYQGNVQSVDAPEGLPYRTVVWVDEASILCAGYTRHPVLFTENNGTWGFSKDFNKTSEGIAKSINSLDISADDDETANPTFGISALKKFKELDLKGSVSASVKESAHLNAIVDLKVFNENNGKVSQVSSCGLDGEIVLYNL